MAFSYKIFTSRNSPIINQEIQEKISKCRVLIVGCGLGSLIAESLVRMGFQKFSLVDHDNIEIHNLNRQAYRAKHNGQDKSKSLKEVILGINPEAKVDAYSEFVNEKNVDSFVADCDVIIDTIDFLDLKSVILLHDKAHFYKKPILSAFAAAWGAVGVLIPPYGDKAYLRTIFSVHEQDLHNLSYTEKFTAFFSRLAPHLNSEVQSIMINVFTKMKDNQPCPASVVITGAQCACIVCEKLIFDFIAGKTNNGPEFYYLDLEKIMANSILNLNI